jgi:hypothetical protein
MWKKEISLRVGEISLFTTTKVDQFYKGKSRTCLWSLCTMELYDDALWNYLCAETFQGYMKGSLVHL